MGRMHDLYYQMLLEEIKPCPKVLDCVCPYRVAVGLVQVFITEQSFRSDDCVPLIPFFYIPRSFENVPTHKNILELRRQLRVLIILYLVGNMDASMSQSSDNYIAEPLEMLWEYGLFCSFHFCSYKLIGTKVADLDLKVFRMRMLRNSFDLIDL